MPRIRLEDLGKHYGDVEVLSGINLNCDDKEFTVLVGPSGCGKSTTLRMIAGLEPITEGEIYFDEAPISGKAPKDRDIAMVFQDYALYPHMNIAKNMSFSLRLQRVNRAEIDERVRRVADILNIGHLLNRKPGELSGGQRQRVAMGRALVRDASTFLFDEPLSNLDAKLRMKMRTELAEMRGRLDKNMIYVTHDQIEAMTLGDRIVVMSDGKIQQEGTPEELFKRPANRFVAGFIGSPTMNFLDARLEGANGSLMANGDGFSLKVSDETAKRLQGQNTADVTIGIRPSSFNETTETGSPITLRVVVSEYLGAHSVLVTRCGSAEVLVEADSAAPIPSNSTMTFGIEPGAIMVFDKESGARL